MTDFGDSAVLTVAAVCVIGMLVALGNPRTAWRFCVTFGIAAFLIAILKTGFIGCGNTTSRALQVQSPSGHTALTTAFWGAVALYIERGRSRRTTRVLVWLMALVVIAGVATSRLALGYHTASEVGLGFAVGIAAIVGAALLTPKPERQTRADRKAMAGVLAAIALVMVVTHGRHFPAEKIIRFCAARVPMYIPACRS